MGGDLAEGEDADAEAMADGATSGYEDVTRPGSVKNIETDVTPQQFKDNLDAAGYTKSVSQDGTVTNYSKGDMKYSVYEKSSSTGGPSVQVFKNGETIEKIRLKQ